MSGRVSAHRLRDSSNQDEVRNCDDNSTKTHYAPITMPLQDICTYIQRIAGEVKPFCRDPRATW